MIQSSCWPFAGSVLWLHTHPLGMHDFHSNPALAYIKNTLFKRLLVVCSIFLACIPPPSTALYTPCRVLLALVWARRVGAALGRLQAEHFGSAPYASTKHACFVHSSQGDAGSGVGKARGSSSGPFAGSVFWPTPDAEEQAQGLLVQSKQMFLGDVVLLVGCWCNACCLVGRPVRRLLSCW